MHIRALQAFKRHRHSLPWLVVKKALASVVTIETLVLFEYELGAARLQQGNVPPGVMLRRIRDVGEPLFGQLCARYPEKGFRARVAVPRRDCHVALRDGAIAGYAWISADRLHIDEIARAIPLASDEVFIYDCFVDESCRGAGIYPAMLRAALQDCAARPGIRRAIIGAASTNHASIRGITKAGFREYKRIRYVRCGTLQRWWGLDAEAAPASAL